MEITIERERRKSNNSVLKQATVDNLTIFKEAQFWVVKFEIVLKLRGFEDLGGEELFHMNGT